MSEPHTFAWAMDQIVQGKAVRRPSFEWVLVPDEVVLVQRLGDVDSAPLITKDDMMASDWEVVE